MSGLMRSGRGVREQAPCQDDGTKLVVKNCFLEVVDVGPGLRRSKSDSHLGCAAGTCPTRADADRDAGGSAAGRPAVVDGCPVGGENGSTTSDRSPSESASVASGSPCSWSEISDCSQYNISGCSCFSDDSPDESCGSSGLAPGRSHATDQSASRREECGGAEPRGAECPKSKEEQHAAGSCRPCLYFRTKTGCSNGLGCAFCHLPHAARNRARPSKSSRVQCRQLLAMLDSKREGDENAAVRLADGGEGNPLVGSAVREQDQKYVLSILRARDGHQGRGPASGQGTSI